MSNPEENPAPLAYAILLYRREFHLTPEQFRTEVDWQDFLWDSEMLSIEAKYKKMKQQANPKK